MLKLITTATLITNQIRRKHHESSQTEYSLGTTQKAVADDR
jgi:hypothetical protein